MSQTDLIGWGSLALFAIFFALLYRFITTPSRKLERTLEDGRALGLSRLSADSPEFEMLAEGLRPFLGTPGKRFRLGSVYTTDRGNGYLFSLVEMSQADRAGGESTEHQDHEKVFWRAPNGLGSFVIRRKPQNGIGVGLSGGVIRKIGRVETIESGLSPAFQRSFVVYGGAPTTVPAELQRVFADPAGSKSTVSGDAASGPAAIKALDEMEGIAFSPDGFLIHLSQRLRARSPEQLKHVLHLAARVEQCIAS